MTACLGKSCSFGLPRVLFVNCCQFFVFSYFPFGFEGMMWDLIVSVPDRCLFFYFALLFLVNLYNTCHRLFSLPLVSLESYDLYLSFFRAALIILNQSYNATVFYFDISFLEHVLNQLFLQTESSISQASYHTMVFTICFQLFKKQTILWR